MGKTEAVARFIEGTGPEDIPVKALDNAKKSLLDAIGVAMASQRVKAAGVLVDTFGRDVGEATILGTSKRADPSVAAFVNGTLIHMLDYDDGNEGMRGHPSGSLVSALLALAEGQERSGRQFLTAYATGYEVGAKLGRHMPYEHYEMGWHNTCTLGTMAATAAGAKFLGLSADQARMALGIAASFASGLRQNFGTLTKPMHMGNAARNGLLGALMASLGWESDPNILEAPLGFCKVFSGGHGFRAELEPALGSPWELEYPGSKLKLYPSCGQTHRPIEGVLHLVEQYDVRPDQVAAVRCGVMQRVTEVLIHSMATTGFEAKFSLNYCVARALMDRKVGIDDFTTERVQEPEIRQLMERVEMYVPPEGQKGRYKREYVDVEITLKDGRVLQHRIYEQKGNPEGVPLTFEEVERKFRDCSAGVLSEQAQGAVVDFVLNLEAKADVGELARLCAVGRRG